MRIDSNESASIDPTWCLIYYCIVWLWVKWDITSADGCTLPVEPHLSDNTHRPFSFLNISDRIIQSKPLNLYSYKLDLTRCK